jgi:hypothetical protein
LMTAMVVLLVVMGYATTRYLPSAALSMHLSA